MKEATTQRERSTAEVAASHINFFPEVITEIRSTRKA